MLKHIRKYILLKYSINLKYSIYIIFFSLIFIFLITNTVAESSEISKSNTENNSDIKSFLIEIPFNASEQNSVPNDNTQTNQTLSLNSEQSENNSRDKFSNKINIETIIIESEQDLEKAIAKAKESAKDLHQTYPEEPITAIKVDFTELTDSSSPITTNALSNSLIKEGIVQQVLETQLASQLDYETLNKDLYLYQQKAARDIKKVVITLSIIRATIAGTISAVSYSIAKAPLETVIATSAFAAIIAGGFQFINDYYKNWITAKAFWDKVDRRKQKGFYQLVYEGWKFGKETMLILGYLVGLGLAGEATGYSSGFWDNSITWLFNRIYGAVLSALSEGTWVIIDATRREQLLTQQYTQYQNSEKDLLNGTKLVLLKSQFAAIVLSAITTTAQVLNTTNNLEISNTILLGLTTSGFIYYAFKCKNLGNFIHTVSAKLANITKDATKKLCARLFGLLL